MDSFPPADLSVAGPEFHRIEATVRLAARDRFEIVVSVEFVKRLDPILRAAKLVQTIVRHRFTLIGLRSTPWSELNHQNDAKYIGRNGE